jgi:hypothetical protein
MTACFLVGKTWQSDAIDWANAPEQLPYQEVQVDWPSLYQQGCDDWTDSADVKFCRFGPQDGKHIAVLFGDSIATQWFSGLALPLISKDWQFWVVTKSACPIVDEPVFNRKIGREYFICKIWRDSAVIGLQGLRPDVLFVGSASDYDFNRQQWLEGTQRIIDTLAPTIGKIYMIPGTFRLPMNGPACLARKKWQPPWIARIGNCEFQGGNEQDESVKYALNTVAGEYANVGVLDLNPLVCPEGLCKTRINGHIVYRDYQHIANDFVERSIGGILKLMDEVDFGISNPGDKPISSL